MRRAEVIVALIIGLFSTVWAMSAWLPLALGYQIVQYSEFNQLIACFEFGCICLGFVWISYVLAKVLRRDRYL